MLQTAERKYPITIVRVSVGLMIIQIIRIIVMRLLFTYMLDNTVNNRVLASSVFMLAVSSAIIAYVRLKKIPISFMPDLSTQKNKIIYAGALAVLFVLILLSHAISSDFSASSLMQTVYSVLITPIFEELIFRGLIWSELKADYKTEWKAYIITTVLFALWHMGYVDTVSSMIVLSGGSGNLAFVMFMKVLTGLVFGVAVGFARLKAKNWYASLLVHSIMNLFGR